MSIMSYDDEFHLSKTLGSSQNDNEEDDDGLFYDCQDGRNDFDSTRRDIDDKMLNY